MEFEIDETAFANFKPDHCRTIERVVLDIDTINEHLNYLLRNSKKYACVTDVNYRDIVTFVHVMVRSDEPGEEYLEEPLGPSADFKFHISTARLTGGHSGEGMLKDVDNNNDFLIAYHTYLSLLANKAL